jgi:L-ascorbate metabolism protein UlaG (beta-lactamase superfamily)
MKRTVLALLAGLLAAAPLAAADKPKEVKIIWHGQSFFEIISSKDTHIVTDPHEIPAYGRIDNVLAHVVTASHFHSDHVQFQVIKNNPGPKDKMPRGWKKPKFIFGLKKQGVTETWNAVNEKFADVRIRSVGTFHDNVNGLKIGKNAVFIFEVDGMNIVHLGDLGHKLTDAQVKAIGKVDVLLIPVGGVYTINGDEAKEVVKQLKPKKYIIPMHCGTKVYDDLLPPDEFLEDQKKELIVRSASNMLTVKKNFNPKAPLIVLLNWEPTIIKKKKGN